MNELLSAHTPLRDFRAELYGCFTRRADALFDLGDALLTAEAVPSPVHLSLAPAHRRGWGSLYAALAQGRVEETALRDLLARCPLADGQPIYAVDCSTWPRCDAETSPDRGYYYHPSRPSAGQPIVAGWSHQWLAQLGFARDSWTAPLDVQRVPPTEDAAAVAVEQITRLVARLPAGGPVPLFVFDAGNDPLKLAQGLAGTRAAILVRLRSDRCFYADPTSQPRTGRPRRHGAKFACAEPATWPAPTAEYAMEDGQYGRVRVRAWAGLHAIPQKSPRPGHARVAADRAGHGGAGRGQSPAARDPAAQAAVAVVVGAGRARPGRPLAGVYPPLRHRAHPALRQADAAVDRAAPAPARASRSLDVAGGRGVHPAAAGARARQRAAPALGAAAAPREADAVPGAAGDFRAPGRPRHAGQPTKTLWPVAGTSHGAPLGAGAPLSGDQEGGLSVLPRHSHPNGTSLPPAGAHHRA